MAQEHVRQASPGAVHGLGYVPELQSFSCQRHLRRFLGATFRHEHHCPCSEFGHMILLTNNEGTSGVPTTAHLLASGSPALDAIEAGIRLIEADPSVRTVGRGGWPNLLCELELDACVMDGTTLRTGAVGALKGYLHPVSVAREIMRRLPHELLVGEGAARFADEIGAPTADNLIKDSKRVWQDWFDRTLTPAQKQAWPNIPLADLCRHAIDPETGRDTTVFLAHDKMVTYARPPAPPAGVGNTPAASATAPSSVPDPTPTHDTGPPPVPARAR
jgi:hypothetical protein